MKKVLSILIFALTVFSINFVNASDFNLNTNFKPVSVIFSGIVNVNSYLSLREYPNINSREIMRIPSGARIIFRESRNSSDWLEVVSVDFNGKEYSDYTPHIGYVYSKYVDIDYRTGS